MHGNGLSKRARGPGGRRVGPLLVAAAILAGAAGLPAADPGGAGPSEERMKVRDVIPDSRTRMPVLLLEDVKTGRRVLPLWIGVAEAKAILMALRNVEVPRPMTHDLMRNLIRDLKAKVVRIVVTDLREHTFIATVYLRSGGNLVQVDSRPSDAVALALRAKAPIFVSSRVLDQAGQIQPVEASPASELRA
ncbi:MAG: bifunctional nuclease family protein, partial [Nitrospinota bacterium]